jgi:hypothetical protein
MSFSLLDGKADFALMTPPAVKRQWLRAAAIRCCHWPR